MKSNDLAHWSRFWQQGFITTFGASKLNNYEGAVRRFWLEKFVELPVEARILDIATGNGAIATIAAEVSNEFQKNFFVAASDLAEISDQLVGNTQDLQLRKNIDFHSHTPCEKQPFEDGFFDFASSQFGFEYGDAELTIQEMRRVLAPGGQFIAISHHVDSDLIKAARTELDVYHYALDELDLFGRVRKLMSALGKLSTSPKKLAKTLQWAKPYSQDVNDGMDLFRQRYPDDECSKEIVGAISYLARGARQATKEQRRAAVEAAADDFRYAQARLQDMVGAALGQEQVDLLEKTARAVGFESVFCLRLFSEDGGLAGWQIHMK